jgi:hypothetical protein
MVERGGRELFAQLLMPAKVSDSAQRLEVQHIELHHLPRTIDIDSLSIESSWAVAAEDLAEVAIPLSGNICIFGARNSGRSTVMNAMAQVWKRLHPLGQVFDRRNHEEISEFTALSDEHPTLILADETTMNPTILEYLYQTTQGRGNVTCIGSASPNFVRSHPEHWINVMRRTRTGLLLGRAALEDADLFGLYSTQPHVFGEANGRGLWVVDGYPVGIVQSASAKFEAVA